MDPDKQQTGVTAGLAKFSILIIGVIPAMNCDNHLRDGYYIYLKNFFAVSPEAKHAALHAGPAHKEGFQNSCTNDIPLLLFGKLCAKHGYRFEKTTDEEKEASSCFG